MTPLLKIYSQSFRGLSTESWMLSIVMLINRTGSMVLPFLGVYMIDSLKFSVAESGLVLSCFGIGSIIGSWIGGYLTDKFGEFYIQASSLFISVPLFCLYPFFSTPLALGLMVLTQSIVSEMFRPANSVAIAKYATSHNLTRAFSLNRMAINLGFSLGPAMGGLLSSVSYSLLFYTNALTTLIAGIVYLVFFNKRQKLFRIKHTRAKRTIDTSAIKLPKERSPYTDFPFIIFCILCTFFCVCFFQLMSTLPLFYKDSLELNQFKIGLLMGANGLVVVLFEMLLVHIAEKKWTIQLTMLYGTLLCALSYLLLGFDPNLAVLFLAMALLSLGEILVLPFMATITALRAGDRNKGAYMGVNGMSFAIALVIAPILGTYIATHFGYSKLWIGTAIILAMCSIGYLYYIPILSKSATSKKKEGVSE